MNLSFNYELVGYAASILVAISLMMKSLVRLRTVNLIGAIVFIVYGLLIHALPIVFLNTLTLSVNAYNLWRMWRQKDYFTLMEIRAESTYLKRFLDFYSKEILEFIPTYLFKPKPDQLVLFVLRNMLPVGVLIVKPDGEAAHIFLDFVIPGYRDFHAGRFLFDASADFFRQRGITHLVTDSGNRRHETYLKRMGFSKINDQYELKLPQKIFSEKI